MDPSLKPRPKVAAAAKAAGGLTLAGVIALLAGADPDDPLVQAIAVAVAAFGPVVAAYKKREARP